MLKFLLFNRKAQRAFSLVEVLLTFLIVAFLIGFSTQYFRKKERKVKSTFEELNRLNKRLISLSHLRSNNYRLVFELSLEEPDRYWVEKKNKRRSQSNSLDQSFSGENRESDPLEEDFEFDRSFYKEPAVMPSFLDITEIETKDISKQEGKIFIDYSNSLLAQEMKIQVLRLDNQARWTLLLDPVGKRLKILK